MKRFAQLFGELDRTTRTNEKVAALERYFAEAPAADAAWALYFFTGRKLSRMVSTKNLWQWMADESKLPEWLIEDCYDAVGDMAETLALLLPDEGKGTELTLAELVNQRLTPLPSLSDAGKRALLLQTWRELNAEERLIWNKLITGSFRVGVARTLVVRALARVAKTDPGVMAHRIMGKWQATAEDFQRLASHDEQAAAVAKAYPFFLASPLEMKIKRGEPLDSLGDVKEWQVEWKWDGIRAQLIRRANETLIWSRGDEMVTDSFPEIAEAAEELPDGTVLDGELLAWREEAPLPFAALQRRLGRKSAGEKIRREFPMAFVAYDLLELKGEDWRQRPLAERREHLEKIISQMTPAPKKRSSTLSEPAFTPALPGFESSGEKEAGRSATKRIRVSPLVSAESWEGLAILQKEARQRGVEGLMLKKKDSPYGVGRQRGDWWKWKIDPLVIDAVMVAAQRGHGRRASLYTDYTFALWQDGKLTPVAKAYSGLTDEEILKVDAFVRHNTTGKFGPVRSVKPVQVFEIAFEGIQKSTRHKSGIAVRFPRINRWRQDKKAEEADSVDNLIALGKFEEGKGAEK